MNGIIWFILLALAVCVTGVALRKKMRPKMQRGKRGASLTMPAPESVEQAGETPVEGETGAEPSAFGSALSSSEIPETPAEPVAPAQPVKPDFADGAVLLWEVFLARLHALALSCRLQIESLENRAESGPEQRLAQQRLALVNERSAHLEESYREELSCHEEVIALLSKLADRFPESPAGRIRDGLVHSAAPGEAEAFLEEWSQDKQNGPTRSAKAAFLSGRLAELRLELPLALERYTRALRLDSGQVEYLRRAGQLAHALGQFTEAGRWRAALVRLLKQKPGGCDPVELALAQRDQAYTYLKVGRYDEAGPLYKSAMQSLGTALGNNHPEMALAWFQIGEMQESQGTFEQAHALYQRSLKMLESKLGLLDPKLCPSLEKLAELSRRFGREQEALAYYRKLLAIQEKSLPPDHPLLPATLNALADIYAKTGDFAQAESCCLRSLKINEAIHEREHPTVVAQLAQLSWLCVQLGKTEEAARYQNEAEALHQAVAAADSE